MLLIYGAGYMGIRYARLLKENGINVDVVSQTIIDWDVYKDLDCITLLEKKK